ncbi:MAG: hypothetical protein KDA22_10850 [Phycisphaerales bacterium]|nr:hypothetical protein [Phycisphaerales bacterium]
MSRKTKHPVDVDVLAVFHRVGDRNGWLGMLFRRAGSGVAILDTRSFDADGTGMSQWLLDAKASQALAVLPASRVICRVHPLPAGSKERLLPALRLQAEAHLLGGVPPHRIGLAILPAAEGETGRSGLILAWPENARVELPPIGDAPVVLTCVPEIAALAALMGAHRPAEPIIWANRDDGSVAIALAHDGGVAYRATREESADAEEWRKGIARAVAETAFTLGHSQAYLTALMPEVDARVASMGRAGLSLPPELVGAIAPNVAGCKADPAWWRTHGIAVGSALAASGELVSLASLMPKAPQRVIGPVAQVLQRLSTPKAATIAVAAALVAIVAAPPIFAGLRLAVLKAKLPDLREYQREMAETERQLAMYRELQKKTWPMTKLLADIANNTPEAIELNSIGLAFGEGLTIQGDAKPKDGVLSWEAVDALARQLNKSGVFQCTQQNLGKDEGNKREFSVLATVKRPYLEVKYAPDEDFAVNTLADRRYGKSATMSGEDESSASALPASGTTEVADRGAATATPPTESALARGSSRVPATGSAGPRRGSARRGGDDAVPEGVDSAEINPVAPGGDAAVASGDSRGLSRRGSSGTAPGAATREERASAAVAIPDPLTDEQIAAMSKAEAESAMSRWAEARLQPGLDEATADRLRKEFYRLMEQSRNGA